MEHNFEISYTQQGDYLLPDLKLPKQDDRPIGIWGQRRKNYLFKHRRILYTNLLTSCKLHAHLADINEEAEDLYFQLVKQLAETEGVTEQLKAADMFEWVRRMNNIQNRAREIVFRIIIQS